MRVCLICVEIFAWGKYGGFGRATRTIGRELARRGVEVFAVVPRRRGQRPVELLDGMTVLSFPMHRPLASLDLFRQADADVYHSCEPSFSTFLAMRAMPARAHMITFRDPRNLRDWKKEFDRPAIGKLQVLSNFLFEHNLLVSMAVRRADIYSLAKYLIPKIRHMYRLEQDPVFMPTPVAIPAHVDKAAAPTVGYLARWDRVKRPELFLDLVPHFPHVNFIAGGHSRDADWDSYLRAKYGKYPNLELLGFVDQFSGGTLHSEVLSKCWIMVNTSTKEALPNAFLEASAHRCAILAGLDPDGFASNFGYFAAANDLADFRRGLAHLLENEHWRTQGERGFTYVRETFETERAIQLHLQAYRESMARGAGATAIDTAA